ncbi:hypothetical protein F5Y00DRAFT_271948 [Daldinia vernicosa]|uniref:uncharacterized protein n=1 Tax=Daldinia vernicosa TaxID=114800 RepID=UPI002008083E|nr:uncharacterized protein F5Y00DRAFT_271948 [Daldinia vernicosa]KAI0846489.1 hypothetical protein F5Y00DRAFT_271948 [Daldinia vernicosa]
MSGSSGNQISWFSEGGAEAVAERIKAFFDRSDRFGWEGTIGSGANGSVYKVKYNSEEGSWILAVKICHIDVDLDGNKSYDEDDEDEGDEVLQLANEKLWLERLRSCPHIIQSFDVNDDPLRQTPYDLAPHRMRTWIFTEYIDNGPLTRLVRRHTELYEGELFPCRLLWRFFMCLIRFCLEMAYCDAHQDGRVDLNTATLESLRELPIGFLAHKDLSRSNIAVGGLLSALQHPEHDMNPILKLLDFGTAAVMDPSDPRSLDDFNRTGPQRNISDIGEVMEYLILQEDEMMNETATVPIGVSVVETFAGSLHAARDDLIARGVDAQLIDLVYCCRVVDPERQPGLIDLAIAVRNWVSNRGDYGVERETDGAIQQRVANLMYNAETGST